MFYLYVWLYRKAKMDICFFVIYCQEDQDWAFVAMVLDRLFLWIFSIASIAGTFMILCEAPALYDDTKPIDVVYSKVAQQQFRLHGFGPDIPENNTTDL